MSLFDQTDYKTYLRKLAKERPRGFKKALSEAVQCQTAYISQVLGGPYHLSVEQAEAATRFLAFTREESRYFVLLVEHQRAGTSTLKKFFEEQLSELRARHLEIKERIGVSETLTEANQARYYGSWHYAAVHMAVTIPALRSRAALSRSLRISTRKLSEVIDFLLSVGLLMREDDRYLPGTARLHLPKDSPSIHRHHANWRLLALDRMHSGHAEAGLNYSSVSSLSEEDARKIRAMLTQAISDAVAVIKDSPEEQLYGIGLDFFRVDD